VDFLVSDFGGAREYFDGGPGSDRWAELESVLLDLVPQFQPSDQAGKIGAPIFDPKGTNLRLTTAAAAAGWRAIPVPSSLTEFGVDWDGGKGLVLAEWQFSNYPFLWNNVIRTEAVFQSEIVLPAMDGPIDALIVVTKSGAMPASNSTLYFEQAEAQLNTVTTLGVFRLPIRLVGLTVDASRAELELDWNQYSGRYSRVPTATDRRFMNVGWGRPSNYGYRPLRLT